MRVTRLCSKAPEAWGTWEEEWEGADEGLIRCWERGREKARENPDLAAAAKRGELVILPWKRGVRISKNKAFGPLLYLAMWQGLRGDDLNIDLAAEVTIQCSSTGLTVTYTGDRSKYCEQ